MENTVLKKFQNYLAQLPELEKALWLDVGRHMTRFNQLKYFIFS